MKNSQPDIAKYDLEGYDYEQYWRQGRSYENESDKIAISKLLKNETGDWYVDLGGSYGRLVPLYRTKFLNCILTDYSIKALKKAKKRLKDGRIQNVELVAANIYNLPFKNGTISGGQLIRVMHHLERPEMAIAEISRILKSNAIFILEFANKVHFLTKIKKLVTFRWRFLWDQTPYQQPSRTTKQGSVENEGLFFNFHPNQIKRIVKNEHFKIIRRLSVSNFRSGILKRVFAKKLLCRIENWMQRPLALVSFGPSQYFKLKKLSGESGSSAKSLLEILCCPKCKGNISKKGSKILCNNCKLEFPITHGIYDLRWPASV